MSTLTIEQREALKAALDARAELLRRAVSGALHGQTDDGTRALADHTEETDGDAIADLETFIDVAQLSRNAVELRNAERALVRWHTPQFGECADCGESIPFSRLQANPLATRCVSCQARRERETATSSHPSL